MIRWTIRQQKGGYATNPPIFHLNAKRVYVILKELEKMYTIQHNVNHD